MKRLILLVSLLASTVSASEEPDISGIWIIDEHVRIIRTDGTFYASGVEPIDDLYGTYEVLGNRVFFTYTMYGKMAKSDYQYALDAGKIVLVDELGYSVEYDNAGESN